MSQALFQMLGVQPWTNQLRFLSLKFSILLAEDVRGVGSVAEDKEENTEVLVHCKACAKHVGR